MLRRTKIGGKKFNKLVIRLRRKGCIHYPLYDIVLMKKLTRRDGTVIEKLGFFNPHFGFKVFIIDTNRLSYWLNCGAIVHSTVKRYMAKFMV